MYVAKAWPPHDGNGGRRAQMPTTGIHLLSAPSHSNSAPSSVSNKNFSSTFEKATRGSASNSEGDCGNPGGPLSVGLCAASMLGFGRFQEARMGKESKQIVLARGFVSS